jgi:hypothetical protein
MATSATECHHGRGCPRHSAGSWFVTCTPYRWGLQTRRKIDSDRREESGTPHLSGGAFMPSRSSRCIANPGLFRCGSLLGRRVSSGFRMHIRADRKVISTIASVLDQPSLLHRWDFKDRIRPSPLSSIRGDSSAGGKAAMICMRAAG